MADNKAYYVADTIIRSGMSFDEWTFKKVSKKEWDACDIVFILKCPSCGATNEEKPKPWKTRWLKSMNGTKEPFFKCRCGNEAHEDTLKTVLKIEGKHIFGKDLYDWIKEKRKEFENKIKGSEGVVI